MKKVMTMKGLSGNQIKLIAIIAMTVDHITWLLFPGLNTEWYVLGLHVIGRLTAPIMWFFIAEGCHYTHDIKKYAARLFAFAIISHFAYNFAFGIPFVPLKTGVFNQTGVMWAYAWAVVVIMIHKSDQIKDWAKTLLTVLIAFIAFPSDWSSIAVMCPFYIYLHRGDFKKQVLDIVIWSAIYAAVYFLFIDKAYGALQMCTALTIPILANYNGERGSWKGMKWFFYAYYPLHLFIIGIIRILLHGNAVLIF